MNVIINGKSHQFDVEEQMPLLWVLRDVLNLTGTKYGCGVSVCGACTVLVDGKAVRSCVTPVGTIQDSEIVTIEGIQQEGNLSVVQQAWIEHQVPQCGYCQPGFILSAESLLKENPNPSEEEIKEKLTNICRCGTYQRALDALLNIIHSTSVS